jgi:transposase
MELLYARCAGLDVHSRTVVACARLASGGEVRYERVTVSTTTRGLLQLADWLATHGVTHAVMEATGVYWKPVWHVLEAEVSLTLANPQHVRNVPGRKSDKTDATWLADLLAVGLIRGSFVPPAAIFELRDLTRTRKQLVREMARHKQRVQKTLEDANIKITEAISDILGVSGRAVVRALIAGETDPGRLADVTSGRLKASPAQLGEVLQGRVTDHHRFMLRLHLQQIEGLEQAVEGVERRIEDQLTPFRAAIDLLLTMPGLRTTAAAVIVAEIGTDMTVFPTAGHVVSWAGLCPRLDESAGKRRSTRTRPTAPWLKPVLIQAAWAAARKKDSYFGAQFRRITTRRGPKKAIVAVAASMLTAAYHMLRDGVEFQDLGSQHFERQHKAQLAQRLVRRLRGLGVEVEIKRPAA